MSRIGAGFTRVAEGDMRHDPSARRRASERLGVAVEWATVTQVHGRVVRRVEGPGPAGEGDALFTKVPGLVMAVFTADCLGVVLSGPGMVGVAHAGWRGLSAGVLEALSAEMAGAGSVPTRAAIGPGIGPCCFEVGREVAARFPLDTSTTTWGTPSVDLVGAARRRLSGMEVEVGGRCTHCQGGFSHRLDRTPARMAALGWIP